MKKSNPDNFFGAKLRELRESQNLTIDEFCNKYNLVFNGRLNKSTVSRYENGIQEPMISTVKKIAQFFAINPSNLLGDTVYGPVYKSRLIPILSTFKAGDPVDESKNIVGYTKSSWPSNIADKGWDSFGLQLHDDSMAPRMCAGDVAIIVRNKECFLPCDGDTMAVSIKGGNAIIRKIIWSDPNGIWLIASNPAFNSQFYTREELVKLSVQVIGYVVSVDAKIEYKTR